MNLSCGAYYYQPCQETEENLALMRLLDELHLEHPAWGSRKLGGRLRHLGWQINRKRVRRLMRVMGIEAICPPRSGCPSGPGQAVFLYLLEGLEISGPNQLWCSDITYIPMQYGFMYLVAVMDW